MQTPRLSLSTKIFLSSAGIVTLVLATAFDNYLSVLFPVPVPSAGRDPNAPVSGTRGLGAAVMVFLAPFITHTGPIASAIERVIEVAIGGVVGLAVSLVVFPARAHDLAIEGAANLLNLIRRLLPELFAGFSHGLDGQTLRHMQASIGAAIVQLDAVAGESQA